MDEPLELRQILPDQLCVGGYKVFIIQVIHLTMLFQVWNYSTSLFVLLIMRYGKSNKTLNWFQKYHLSCVQKNLAMVIRWVGILKPMVNYLLFVNLMSTSKKILGSFISTWSLTNYEKNLSPWFSAMIPSICKWLGQIETTSFKTLLASIKWLCFLLLSNKERWK